MPDPGSEQRIHVGDIGVDFIATISADLTSSTGIEFHIQRPDGTALSGSPFTGIVSGALTDGVVKISPPLTDVFDVPGLWTRWVRIEWALTDLKGGETIFVVHP